MLEKHSRKSKNVRFFLCVFMCVRVCVYVRVFHAFRFAQYRTKKWKYSKCILFFFKILSQFLCDIYTKQLNKLTEC